jgi:alpha-glucosidase (family GH31 glycosyl hydrolase)
MFSANYTGGTVVYPLIFDYPADDEAFKNIESTFMLGDALKISPVLDYS